MSKPRRAPDPPPKKSRSITMALLGAVTLCSCCCCLLPAPPDDGGGDGGGGDFSDAQEFAADGTPSTATTGRNAGHQTTHNSTGRSHYGGPFWLPLFFGNSYSRGPGVNSPSRTPTPGGVTTGGFGGTGRSMTGGGTGGGSAS